MSSKYFGNKTVKQTDTTNGGKSKGSNQNTNKITEVRKTGRGK